MRVDAPRPLLSLTDKPHVEQITISTPEGLLEADLYLPANVDRKEKLPGAIFVYGVIVDYREASIVELSEMLARLNMAVLVPNFSGFFSERVYEKTIPNIISSFQYLQDQEFIDPERIGFMGFCVGGSLALVASADPVIADQVAYIQAITPYSDLRSFGAAVFSRQYVRGGEIVDWQPDSRSVAIFRKEYLILLPEEDLVIFEEALFGGSSDEEYIRERLAEAEFIKEELDEKSFRKLSETGQIVWELFQGTPYERAKELQTKLYVVSSSYQAASDARSPEAHIDEIRAPVFLTYSTDSAFIPFTESVKLKEAFGDQVTAVQFSILEHVRPTREIPASRKIREMFQLWSYFRKVLQAAM